MSLNLKYTTSDIYSHKKEDPHYQKSYLPKNPCYFIWMFKSSDSSYNKQATTETTSITKATPIIHWLTFWEKMHNSIEENHIKGHSHSLNYILKDHPHWSI